jgi:topoisomerase IV subunit B
MDPAKRTLLRVSLPPRADAGGLSVPAAAFARTRALVDALMGRRPEPRFEYIQKNARFARNLDI